jgi:hypothetical protein
LCHGVFYSVATGSETSRPGPNRFVLRGQELRYFKEECPFDSDAAPQPDASHTCVGIDEGGGKYFTLRVTDEAGAARDFPLYAEVPADRVRWLAAVRAAAAAGPLRIQRCTNDSAVDVSWDSADTDYDEAKASRRSDYYFAFFLCYPSMTQSFFNHFNCRRLSPTLWVLQKDYSEQCYEGWYVAAVLTPVTTSKLAARFSAA